MPKFDAECPACHRTIKAGTELVGKRVKCPGCKQPFVLTQETDDDGFDPDNPFAGETFPSEPLFPPAEKTPPPAPAAAPPESTAFEQPSPYQPTYSQQPIQQRGPVPSDLPESRSYPALNIIRRVLLILAALVAIGWLITVVVAVIGLIMVMVGGGDSAETGGTAIAAFLYLAATFLSGAFTCCLLVAQAELIKVILDIQENTLAAARR